MRRQVLPYVKPVNELKAGDRILTGRMTIAEVEATEAFADSTKRPCVAVVLRSGTQIVSATNFLADESVLVVE